MRSTAEINQDIFTAANRRLAIYEAGVHHPDDLYAIRALGQRLFDLYEEKRMSMAEDQGRAKHRARLDAVVDNESHMKLPWESTAKLNPLGMKESSMDRTLVRHALVRFDKEARDAAAA
jgi:hypothetical protein